MKTLDSSALSGCLATSVRSLSVGPPPIISVRALSIVSKACLRCAQVILTEPIMSKCLSASKRAALAVWLRSRSVMNKFAQQTLETWAILAKWSRPPHTTSKLRIKLPAIMLVDMATSSSNLVVSVPIAQTLMLTTTTHPRSPLVRPTKRMLFNCHLLSHQ